MSGAPPGGIVTRTFTGRDGYCCAFASPTQSARTVSAAQPIILNIVVASLNGAETTTETGDAKRALRRRCSTPSVRAKQFGEMEMTLKVRRVITGHDANGKAIVQIDEVVAKLKEGRPGAMVAPIWTTEGFPVNNDGQDDAATRQVGTTLANGTILRVVEFSPGVQSRNHRTDSIDYAIIMSGEIDMEMDGAMIHLKAGDVLVQRGTIHNWINTGSAPCVIAFALIDGKPVTAGGKVLNAAG
jgi:quercetin dioxygenase-like cupin family protein